MESHTVPRKLLDQFAYDDPRTGSRRLWQYAPGREPWWKASPRTATRVTSHFADPADSEREAKVEQRLNEEFEDPVHQFIEQLKYRTFPMGRTHVRKLTRYITLLWNRSSARRHATKELVAIGIESSKSLLQNEEQLAKIAAKWTFEILRQGHPLKRTVLIDEVKAAVQKMIENMSTQDHVQTTYVDTIERAMAHLDDGIENGLWNLIQSKPGYPFVIGDTPVVTWKRGNDGVMLKGFGFSEPDVEVALPIAPSACIYILPDVKRTLQTRQPSVKEINELQASFASQYCYGDVNRPELNKVLQPHFNTSKMAVNVFSVRHKDYTNTMFEIFMNSSVPPPI